MDASTKMRGFWAAFWTPNRGMNIATEHRGLLLISIVLYLPMIWVLQWYMRSRTPYKLKWAAFLWNLSLSFLSALGVLLVLFDDWRVLLSMFVAEETFLPNTRSVIALFCLTKPLEFGDTFILVFKKKPVIFLHVYHHLTVALYCWHAQYANVQFAHPFAIMNLAIHSGMYLYYAAAVVIPRHPVLRSLRPFITKAQTLQMLIGMYISMNAIFYSGSGGLTDGQLSNAWYSLVMYCTYVYLFGKFYLENYIEGVRPVMTLVIGTLHIVAMVGFAMWWRHTHRLWIAVELLIGYFTTVLLLRLFNHQDPYVHQGKAPYEDFAGGAAASTAADSDETISPLSDSTADVTKRHMLNDTTSKQRQVAALPRQVSTDGSRMEFLTRIGLMLLNTWATWAREHRSWKLRQELQSLLQGESGLEEEPENKSRLRRLSSGGDSSPSLLGTLVRKHKSKAKADEGQFPMAVRPLDNWLVFLCVVLPSLYGFHAHGSLFMGLCVHGCLRWIVELHTTDALVPNMKIAKFG